MRSPKLPISLLLSLLRGAATPGASAASGAQPRRQPPSSGVRANPSGSAAASTRTGQATALAVALAAASAAAFAAGPAEVAGADAAAWPQPLDSPAAFDRASRAHVLVFARELAQSEALDDAALAARLRLKQIDRASVDRIRARFWQRLAANYRLAARACAAQDATCPAVADAAALRRAAADFGTSPALPAALAAWRNGASDFHRVYLDEQLRLAALFPRVSSEIDRYSEAELSGDELPDRSFLLSFDDGPTAAGGRTDALLAMLREHRLNATFFVLGQSLQRRAEAPAATPPARTYAGMCVASHGWEHRSHARWPQWQASVLDSSAAARRLAGPAYRPLFRPPYGQRSADSEAFFRENGLRVALWSIDSQDWNARMSAAAMQGRVLNLMLLWRRGTLLFHDIHDKARQALPGLLRQTQGAGLRWVDCQDYPAAP